MSKTTNDESLAEYFIRVTTLLTRSGDRPDPRDLSSPVGGTPSHRDGPPPEYHGCFPNQSSQVIRGCW